MPCRRCVYKYRSFKSESLERLWLSLSKIIILIVKSEYFRKIFTENIPFIGINSNEEGDYGKIEGSSTPSIFERG